MAEHYLIIYTIISFLLCGVDFYFAVKAFRKPNKIGRALGFSATSAGIITLAYVLSVNTSSDALVSVMSSVTFAGIDCLLVSLAYFAFLLPGLHRRRGSRAANTVLRTLASVDIIVMLVNIFTGIAVTYVRLNPVGIGYQMKTPYIIHLAYSYFMILVTLAVLINKCVHTPRQYRNQYLQIVMAIGVVVLINALFLFQQEGSFFTKVDCSILGYSIGLYLMYWTAYDYREKDMLESLSMTVFQNISQGIVLFDYMDELIMYNRKAGQLLPGVPFQREMPGARFLESCGIALDGRDNFSTQCDAGNGVPLRCDYRQLKDQQNRVLGHLYVFTDITRDTDITTGFEYAKGMAYAEQNEARIARPAAVAIFDIIGLRDVNRVMGRDEGDKRIRALAKEVRRCMPEGSIFLRGYEAYLIAVCPGKTEQDIRGAVENVVGNSESRVMFGLSAAEDAAGAGERTLAQAMETAYRSLQIKKLLGPESVRSQALASLVRALEEADADTESHVRRTQKMGAMLGKRIHLTDAELAQLELLCLLHDIGKIGIPLEILNKPGKLADQEWAVLRTHPEKGYQIAMSSDELKSIAEMILYHHERWDGNGYPKKLAGADIPVLSRIISVVDAYDAMVNDRSYRKAMTPEAAQAEIRGNAGTQFDPQLAAEFLAMLSENPDLAQGEKVSAGGEQARQAPLAADAVSGNTAVIAYSRYLLDDDNVIIEVDDHFEEITGYAPEDVLNRMAQKDLIPPEDRAFYLIQVSNQLARASMAYLRHEILRKDGERIQVACCGKRYFDSAAKAFRNEIIVFRL